MSAKTKSRTPEAIYKEIETLRKQDHDAAAALDSPEYWREATHRAERQRDLWREVGEACDAGTPEWARLAAFRTGDLYADLADRYRRFGQETETEALRKQADA